MTSSGAKETATPAEPAPPPTDEQIRTMRWTESAVKAHGDAGRGWQRQHRGEANNPYHFRGADLRRLDLTDHWEEVDFRGADMRDALLSGASFVRCNLSFTRLERATMLNGTGRFIRGCRLVGATGLFGDERATWGRFVLDEGHPSEFQRWGVGRWWGDAPNWRHLAFIGGLPIFGVSNVALFGILAYAGFVEWYNRQFARVVVRMPEGADSTRDFLAHLGPLPAPSHLANLLIILLGLLAASTVYRVRCPDETKEFSRAGWERQGGEMIQYLSALYSRPLERWMCGVLYVVFGGWAALYLLRRVVAAMVFLFGG